MKSVLYMRMSTDRQEASISQQRDALVAFAAKQGHEIVGEYVDEGISGDATHKRKGFQAMIRAAAGGGFDRILCWDQSRFGRFDSIEAGSWITPLRDAGVSLETMDSGAVDWNDFAGRITFAVAQEGKNAFLRDLSRSSLRGMAAKIRDGRGLYGGSTPYGYRRETAIIDRKRITTLVSDEITGPIVQRMFETYAAAGGSLYSVVEMLNGEGIRSPYGCAQWRRSSVRRILTNPIYAGDIAWGRTMSGKYHARIGDEIVARRPGQRPAKNVPIVQRDAVPALVDRELFDRTQELLAKRKKATRRPASVRPLSGLVTCGCCGSPMHADGEHYRCSRGVDFGHGSRCTASAVRADIALDALAGGLQKNLLAPARLRAVKDRLERLVETERRATATGDTGGLDRRISDLDRQVSEGIARIPLLPKSLVPELAKNLDALRARRDALTRQRDAMGRAAPGDRLPVEDRVAQAIAAAYGLRDALRASDPAILNNLLRNLGVRVAVAPGAATVVVDPMPAAESVETCLVSEPTRNKSHTPLLSFTIAVPAGRPGPKPRRKAC
jgi:DNA invertase Pin-like site-specific DNA recombinase